MNERIILASSSPRRIEMMEKHGYSPVIIKPECEENLPEKIDRADAVMFLSLKKALEVENKVMTESPSEYEGAYIVAADTIVYTDRIIGKPVDEADAYEMISSMNGKMHYVLTGVSILKAGTTVRKTFYNETRVFFKEYTEDFIKEYIKTKEPYDKAGGYAIQGTLGQYIDHIEGDLLNVVGFPWDRFEEEFNRLKEL